MAGRHRGVHRVQAGRAGQPGIGSRQLPGRPQQQRRGLAAPVRGERELSAHQVGAGPPGLARWSGRGLAQQFPRRVEHTGLDLGRRRGQRPVGAPRRVRGQPGRALQERGRRGQPRARLGPAGLPLELGGDSLIGVRRGLGPVPGPPVGVGRAGGLRQGAVRGPPVVHRRRPVGRRTRRRVPESHPGTELQQARPGYRRHGLNRDAQPPGGAPDHHRVAGRLGRRDHQQPPARAGQVVQLPPDAVLHLAWPRQHLRQHLRQAEPARQLGLRHRPRQLKQGQRVPPRLGHDLVPHPLVQRPPHGRAQQLPCVRVPQPPHRQLGQRAEVRVQLPRRDHHQHRPRSEPARHERHRLRRGLVQPLRVIDHADQRPVGGRLGQQVQHRQADQETVRRRA